MPKPSARPSGPVPSPDQPDDGYHQLFNLSLDLLCIAGLDGRFIRVNPSWTRVLGWSEAELLERRVEDFMHPEDRERTLAARASLAKGIPVQGLENRYLCKDRTHRWLSWQSSISPDGFTVFAVARDITDQRQRAYDRLVLSKLESTGILAGGIAHDFNNLLAGLMLNLEMVGLDQPTTPDQQLHLRQARQAILAAKALTQQLIAFADGGVPSRQITDLAALLHESLDATLDGSSLHHESGIAADLWPVDVDEEQLSQVIRGLVLNAREATDAGGRVQLHADNVVFAHPFNDLPAGEYLRIQIADNGTGIPANILPRIFDPYFSTKQRGSQKGMGLGLTLAQTIIRKHRGAISIDSNPGRGTTVTLHLPANRGTQVRPAQRAATPTGARPRVLVMDDEEILRETMALTLQQMGYDVDVAADGSDAVAAYERARQTARPFAVVLLDLTVRGGMGGSEAMRQLQALDPSVSAALMTGYTHESTFREYARHGFKGALAKPFSADALRDLLAQIVSTPNEQAP